MFLDNLSILIADITRGCQSEIKRCRAGVIYWSPQKDDQLPHQASPNAIPKLPMRVLRIPLFCFRALS